MSQHKVELGAIVLDCEQGQLKHDQHWQLVNVSGKLAAAGDETLTYCLVFTEPRGHPANRTLIVKVWPLAADRGRRNGRPEAGFMVVPPAAAASQTAGFYATPAYSVVFATGDASMIRCIYFTLEDRNLEPVKTPLWQLAVNESAVLATLECLEGRWTPLPAVHPDPSMDPGVPIHRQPQGTIRWHRFKDQTSNYHVFKHKISSSVLYKFLGGGYKLDSFLTDADGSFKGNHLTRHGNVEECKIVLAHLLRFTHYTACETGSWPHPSIGDACGAPDAMLYDAQRTFEKLPRWLQTLWLQESEEQRRAIDWTTGVFEAKAMLKEDKHGRGPEIKPEHICQVYWNMICTGTHWGELARACHATRQGRVFRIYRRPDIARKLELCVRRMHSEMIAGTPYLTAVRSELNEELVKEFRGQATYYNAVPEPGALKHYYDLPWPAQQVKELEDALAAYDICRSESNVPQQQPLEDKRAKKKARTQSAEPAPTAVSLFPVLGVDAAYMSDGRYLEAYELTNKALGQALRNGDYHIPLEEKVFELQVVRLMNMKARAHAALALQGANDMSPPPPPPQ